MSLAILLRVAIVLRMSFTIASFAARASNLFGAVLNGCSVKLAIFSYFYVYPFGVFSPVPTAVPPKASSLKWSKDSFKAFIPCSN